MSSSLVIHESDVAQAVSPQDGIISDLQQDAITQLRSSMEALVPSAPAMKLAVKTNKSLVRPLRDEAYMPGTPPQQAELLLALAAACVCSQACDNVALYVQGLRRRAARSAGYSTALAIEYHLIALQCLNRMLATRQMPKGIGHTWAESEGLYNQAFMNELDNVLCVVGAN